MPGMPSLIELPYGQGNYSMVVMLPDEGFTVADAAATLTPENWDSMDDISEVRNF